MLDKFSQGLLDGTVNDYSKLEAFLEHAKKYEASRGRAGGTVRKDWK